MKSEFIKLYEELSQLNEAKQDTLNFKSGLYANGASESEADNYTKRFDAIKSMLKAPENDYYYGIKRMRPQDLYDVINNTERVAEVKKNRKQEIAEGAKLVHESEHGKIYHITNFDASQYYGRDSRWCVTGIGNFGDKYGNVYTHRGYTFYFCIAKQDYDPRGKDSKFAIALHKGAKCYLVFDQQDNESYLGDIPYYEEIVIPGINLQDYTNIEALYCEACGAPVLALADAGECYGGENSELYCKDCGSKYYFICGDCGEMFGKDQVYVGLDGNEYCYGCGEDKFYKCSKCHDTIGLDDVNWDKYDGGYCDNCGDERLAELENEDDEE